MAAHRALRCPRHHDYYPPPSHRSRNVQSQENPEMGLSSSTTMAARHARLQRREQTSGHTALMANSARARFRGKEMPIGRRAAQQYQELRARHLGEGPGRYSRRKGRRLPGAPKQSGAVSGPQRALRYWGAMGTRAVLRVHRARHPDSLRRPEA